MNIRMLNSIDYVTAIEKDRIAEFLYHHLDEFGDKKEDILKCLEYALSKYPHQGGFVLLAEEEGEIMGAVVINHTNMSDYIPENILVYIAVHQKTRGRGVGKKLMQRAIELAKGDIALHVEPNNPARFLYEKLGFTNKYLEMRFHKEKDNGNTETAQRQTQEQL